MRTTLDIDADVLQAVEEMAESRGTTDGRVISDLAREALRPVEADGVVRNGVPLLASRAAARPVTLEVVDRLRDGGRPDGR